MQQETPAVPVAPTLETLEDTREQLSGRLEQPSVTGADRRGLEQRINSLDGRITVLDKQIADADALVRFLARFASIFCCRRSESRVVTQGASTV